MNKVIKVWVSRYALAKGIQEMDAEVCLEGSPDGTMVKKVGSWGEYYHKPDWHESRAEAVIIAKAKLKRKIASMEKQLTKLRKMSFS